MTPGTDEHDIITEAVGRWAKRKRLDPAAKADKACMAPFVQRGVPESTLRKHLNGALSLKKERRAPPPLINPSLARVTADSLASADNGNKGLSRKAAISTLAGARGLNPKQATDCWDRRVRRDAVNAGMLKHDTVSAAGSDCVLLSRQCSSIPTLRARPIACRSKRRPPRPAARTSPPGSSAVGTTWWTRSARPCGS